MVKKKPSLDIARFIMAIVVVSIHTHPLKNCHSFWVVQIYDNITLYAVPFFFLCSGYFLFHKIRWEADTEHNIVVVNMYIKTTFKLYSIWSLIYLPFAIFDYVTRELTPVRAIVSYFRNFIFVGEHYFSWPLWYLLSYLWALLLLDICIKYGNKKLWYTISGGVLLAIVFFPHFAFENTVICAIQLLTIGESNRIFYGIFYVMFAGLIVDLEKQLKATVLIWPYCVIAIFLLFLLDLKLDSYLMTIIVSILLFWIVLNVKIPLSKRVCEFMRESSRIIYLIHMLALGLYIALGNKEYGFQAFLFTIAVSVACSISVIKLKSKKCLIPLFKILCI